MATFYPANHPHGATEKWFFSVKFRIIALEISFPVALVLGTIGYLQYHHEGGQVSFTNALYHSVQLFILHAAHFENPVPPALEAARWLAATSTLLLVVNSVLWFFQRERLGMKLRFMRNHSIVCGLGAKGRVVISELAAHHSRIVAIDRMPDPETVEWLRRLNIPLVAGDARHPEILQQARIQFAGKVFALCSDDQVNCDIALTAGTLCGTNTQGQECLVHVNDHDLRVSLQRLLKNNVTGGNFSIRFADAFLPEAIHLLTQGLPLDHEGISRDSSSMVRLVIVGFGRMGRTIAKVAAQSGQFANREIMDISVIDKDAGRNRDVFLFHHPRFGSAAHISFFQHDIQSPDAVNFLENLCSMKNALISIVFCIDNETLILDSVMTLMPVFRHDNVRVAVRMREPGSMAGFLNAGFEAMGKKQGLAFFGYSPGQESLIHPELEENENFAANIHHTYLTFRKAQLKDQPGELERELMSGSLSNWQDLDEDLKESCRQQAARINFKLRSLNYRLTDESDPQQGIDSFPVAEAESLAEMEHRRWMAERFVSGWEYNREKSIGRKCSPFLVPWEKLPEEIREYDRIFVRLIPEMAGNFGKKIVKNH